MVKIVIKVNGSLWTSDPIYTAVLKGANKGLTVFKFKNYNFTILKDRVVNLMGDREIEAIMEKIWTSSA